MLCDTLSLDIQNLHILKHLTSSEIEFIKEIKKITNQQNIKILLFVMGIQESSQTPT